MRVGEQARVPRNAALAISRQHVRVSRLTGLSE
jgi:hypothetical protein